MGRVGWVVWLILCLSAVVVWADCGCAPEPSPTCYTMFRSNETIEFSLVVPLEYFECRDTTETPLITGWRVETQEGILVKRVSYTEPLGAWRVLTWDLSDDRGYLVGSGYYRIIVETSSAGDVLGTAQVVSCCDSCCNPCRCSRSVRHWVRGCPATFGNPYIELRSGRTTFCCGVTIRVYGTLGCGCGAP